MQTDLLSVCTVALLKVSRDAGAPFVALALDDLHIHKARAQVQELQIVSDDSRKVLVVSTISVPVKIGRVLTPLTINEGMSTQLLRHPAQYKTLTSI